MTAIVIEHVKVSELPEIWRAHITATENARVTVRIEPEATVSEAAQEDSDDPLFGMWHDRAEMADVQAYLRKLRAPRF
jgi:diaminopimelate decarboxylase